MCGGGGVCVWCWCGVVRVWCGGGGVVIVVENFF